MHPSALYNAKLFSETYIDKQKNITSLKVLEIGSKNVQDTILNIRNVLPESINYIGVDFDSGNNVDVVISDPYKLPFEDESIDYIISSSCFEHSEFFWLVYIEIMRVLKPTGLLYINVPNNGYIHRYPVDCWRFYPDSGMALVNWGIRNGINNTLLESFISNQSNSITEIRETYSEINWNDYLDAEGRWNDFVAIILKDSQYLDLYNNRISDIPKLRAYSFYRDNIPVNPQDMCSEDFLIQDEMRTEISSLKDGINSSKYEITSLKEKLNKSLAHVNDLSLKYDLLKEEKKALSQELNLIKGSKCWSIFKYFIKRV